MGWWSLHSLVATKCREAKMHRLLFWVQTRMENRQSVPKFGVISYRLISIFVKMLKYIDTESDDLCWIK